MSRAAVAHDVLSLFFAYAQEATPAVGPSVGASVPAVGPSLAPSIAPTGGTTPPVFGGGATVFTEFLSIFAIGLRLGAIYSLIGLGLALVYKATRVFNFAHGEIGTMAIFVAWLLGSEGGPFPILAADGGRSGLNIALATGFAVVAGIVIAIATYGLIVRPMQGKPPVMTLVITAGIALMFVAIQIIFGEAQARAFPRHIEGCPFGTVTEGNLSCGVNIGGVIIDWQSVLILGVLIAVAFALAVFFQTKLGTALLATAQEPFAARLYGISTNAMALLTWATAGALAALGGILAMGFDLNFTPGVITSRYLVPAFAAAILGGITSMPGTVIGGLLLGMIQAASNTWLPDTLPGRPQLGVFVVLLLILLVRPRGLLGKEA